MNHVRRVKGAPFTGNGADRKPWGWVLVGAIGMMIALGLIGPCFKEPAVNSELAKSVRTAVESADQAHRDNDAAYLWPGRLRLLTVILGVSVPIMAAVVLAWLAFRRQPGDHHGPCPSDGHCEHLPSQPCSPAGLLPGSVIPVLPDGAHEDDKAEEDSPATQKQD